MFSKSDENCSYILLTREAVKVSRISFRCIVIIYRECCFGHVFQVFTYKCDNKLVFNSGISVGTLVITFLIRHCVPFGRTLPAGDLLYM